MARCSPREAGWGPKWGELHPELPAAAPLPVAWLASVVGVAPLRPAPSWEAAFSKLLPVSFSFAASLFLGNVAYLGMSGEHAARHAGVSCQPASAARHAGVSSQTASAARHAGGLRRTLARSALSRPPLTVRPPRCCVPAVAFINIMKAATPMVTLAVGLALRLERTSKLTLAATVLIAVGTAISTSSEASSGEGAAREPRAQNACCPPGLEARRGVRKASSSLTQCACPASPAGHFRWLSFFAFALSVVFEGIRVVLTEKLLGQVRLPLHCSTPPQCA